MGPGGFTPDPSRLYEVGRDGRPYTLEPEPPGAAQARDRLARRWWIAAVLVNAVMMGLAAGAALLAPQAVAALFGILPILTVPLLLVSPLIRRRGRHTARRVHRQRPGDFPPPGPP